MIVEPNAIAGAFDRDGRIAGILFGKPVLRIDPAQGNWARFILCCRIIETPADEGINNPEDWAVDVKKYASDADEKAIAGIVRRCGSAIIS